MSSSRYLYKPAFQKYVSTLLENYSAVYASLNARRHASRVVDAKLAFQHGAVLRGRQRAERTHQNACAAADAFLAVDDDYAVFLFYCPGYAAFNAKRFVAMSAADRETDGFRALSAFFDSYARAKLHIFESVDHIAFAGVGESAVIFAKVTA
jgi:hypothetical protein